VEIAFEGANIFGYQSTRNVPNSRTLISVYSANYVRPIPISMGTMLEILRFYSVKVARPSITCRTAKLMILKPIKYIIQILFDQHIWHKCLCTYIYIYIYIYMSSAYSQIIMQPTIETLVTGKR
jgi:hypothetical protein